MGNTVRSNKAARQSPPLPVLGSGNLSETGTARLSRLSSVSELRNPEKQRRMNVVSG